MAKSRQQNNCLMFVAFIPYPIMGAVMAELGGEHLSKFSWIILLCKCTKVREIDVHAYQCGYFTAWRRTLEPFT